MIKRDNLKASKHFTCKAPNIFTRKLYPSTNHQSITYYNRTWYNKDLGSHFNGNDWGRFQTSLQLNYINPWTTVIMTGFTLLHWALWDVFVLLFLIMASRFNFMMWLAKDRGNYAWVLWMATRGNLGTDLEFHPSRWRHKWLETMKA